jgi:hypothetical protein
VIEKGRETPGEILLLETGSNHINSRAFGLLIGKYEGIKRPETVRETTSKLSRKQIKFNLLRILTIYL